MEATKRNKWTDQSRKITNYSPYYVVHERLSNGCLIKSFKIVVPTALRKSIFSSIIQELFVFPIGGQVSQKRSKKSPVVAHDANHLPSQQQNSNFQPMNCQVPRIHGKKSQLISHDHSRQLQTIWGIIVVVGYYSGLPELHASNYDASTVTKWLDELFSRYGNTDILVWNKGPEFIGTVFFKIHRRQRHQTSPNACLSSTIEWNGRGF